LERKPGLATSFQLVRLVGCGLLQKTRKLSDWEVVFENVECCVVFLAV